MDQHQLALQAQIEKLQKQNELMRKLSTPNGFCNYYFEILPQFQFNHEAFNHVNQLYADLFGQPRYADAISFRQILRAYHRKK